ncbi:MAG: Putative esterase [uncultured Acidimicrobiales bacterium]|uniref:Esterase n=1 Tax=uncultured Acidimicrobiales bacterium TaxID=310071 RepID=A0A6J4H3V6_9ACTN|nr:MAG: Putative esterase [uncultured Acidimicrobiales bacterium]
MADAMVEGSCEPGFEKVREVFTSSFDKGEVGAGVAVYVDGQAVVDLWGGWADGARTRPWQRDTIVNTFSTTKGMTATCAHRLVEEGRLDVDERVATYWPEFAQAGKQDVTVRHLLNHQAGLPGITAQLAPEKRFDWDTVTTALAAQAPAWEPGTHAAYHAVTFGYLVGEVVRRIDGRSLGTYFEQEIAEPLGLDFMIGFGPEHDERCAEILVPPPEPDGTLSPAAAASAGMARGTGSRTWRAAEIPAANGHGTAAAVARMYGALARGGDLAGVHVLRPETISAATVRQEPEAATGSSATGPGGGDTAGQLAARGPVGITGLPFALGYMVVGDFLALRAATAGGPTGQPVRGASAFGHPGAGGSIGAADPVAKVGFGYVMNQMQAGMVGGAHGFNLIAAVYDCLG